MYLYHCRRSSNKHIKLPKTLEGVLTYKMGMYVPPKVKKKGPYEADQTEKVGAFRAERTVKVVPLELIELGKKCAFIKSGCF